MGRERTTMNESFEKIRGRLGEAEVLAQLAEECAELAQAALKLRRALDGRNPTPKSIEDCRNGLVEEYSDVVHCAIALGILPDSELIREKSRRWWKRLGVQGREAVLYEL